MSDQMSTRRRRKHAETLTSVADSIAYMHPKTRFTSPLGDAPEQPIRWPFRVLAALLVSASVIAFLGSAYAVYARHELKAALSVVTFFPMSMLILRVGFHAVWFGRIAPQFMWPFASGKVALAWILFTTYITQNV